ncbi:hypothetical protein NEOC84_000233|uniref:ABC transporter permease n=1 Tax=Neochlamydia sp. AcF84 TaxID=2315858 RepID=UPI00140A4DCD|nr:ABC transporter permease [Neochlamydia sp. AcF84]NGY94363.1 hypothetical protein [Neochlamydia sp. AcF84]
MFEVAFKMLIGDKAKFLGLIFGIFLSSFLICQQSAIFLGLVERSYRLITDIPTPEIWVMDPGTEHIDKIREMSDSQIDKVRSVPGILWAAPLSMAYLPLKLSNGLFHEAQVVAIDQNSLLGAPQHMVKGVVESLRHEGGIILDQHAVREALVTYGADGKPSYLKLGDSLEVADQYVIVVGIAQLTLGFYPQPIMYMAYQQYKNLTPFKNRHLGFILARVKPGENVEKVVQAIKDQTGLSAFTREGFKWRSIWYFLSTGVLINFGTTVLSGFLLGIAIVGIMFYMLTIDSLPFFAMLRALGATPLTIAHMIYFQALVAGIIGFGLGLGAATLAGQMIIFSQGTIAFLFPPLVFLFAAFTIVLINLLAARICIRRVLKEDPKIVMSK